MMLGEFLECAFAVFVEEQKRRKKSTHEVPLNHPHVCEFSQVFFVLLLLSSGPLSRVWNAVTPAVRSGAVGFGVGSVTSFEGRN